MKRPPIPKVWTGEQALAVVDWLQGVVDAIWDEYGDELIEQLAQQPTPNDDRQVELPF